MLEILSLNFLVCHRQNDAQLIISAVIYNWYLLSKIKYLLENTLRRRHNTCLKMNLVIYIITNLYTQWNISYKSGSVLNNHDIFQNICRYIYFNEILLAQSKIILKKKHVRKVSEYINIYFQQILFVQSKIIVKKICSKSIFNNLWMKLITCRRVCLKVLLFKNFFFHYACLFTHIYSLYFDKLLS